MDLKGEILSYRFRDVDTDEVITLYYRKPYTRERMRYSVDIWDPEHKRMKADEEVDGYRVEWGGRIIEGMEFDGRKVKVSSDPQSPHYNENWRSWLQEKAPQLLETLAIKVFQGLNLYEEAKKEGEDPPEKKS